MESFSVNVNRFDCLGKVLEAVGLSAYKNGLDMVHDNRYKILCEKKRIASARAAVLNRRAIAVSYLAVFEHKHDGYRLARLTYRCKSRRFRLADIRVAVRDGAALYCALIVKIKPRTSRRTYYIDYFHNIVLSLLRFISCSEDGPQVVPC